MKIGIHNRLGSFSEKWICYCKKNNIDYKVVNAFDDDIIEQLSDCEAFMWHHHYDEHKDFIYAKQLLSALQQSGKKVFPDFYTGWFFDDKLGQKYLLEACGAPLVPSHVFFSKEEALNWAKHTEYPVVFKLRGGAGSFNVRLVGSFGKAKKLIERAFGRGFSHSRLKDSWCYNYEKVKQHRKSFRNLINLMIRELLIRCKVDYHNPKEYGYIYFQEFMPGNEYDQRIVVIDGKYALGEKRYVRKNDFRASGSGNFDYKGIDINVVKVAFDVAKKLKLQSVAFDIVYDKFRNPKIVEMCYGFGTHGIEKAPGYWTDDLEWHKGEPSQLFGWMVESLLK